MRLGEQEFAGRVGGAEKLNIEVARDLAKLDHFVHRSKREHDAALDDADGVAEIG